MKIVQAAILTLVGALAALLFVKISSGPEAPPPVPQAALEQPAPPAIAPPAEPPTPPPAAEAPPAAPEPAPKPAPAPAPRATKRPQAPKRVWVVEPPRPAPARVEPRVEPRVDPLPQMTRTVPDRSPAPAPAPLEPPPIETARLSEPRSEPPPEPPPPPRQATLTAGTLLPVRLEDTISSDRYHPGDTFTAVLDRPLVTGGLVIAEKGARVEGKIVESQRAGRLKGLAAVALELTRLSLSDGQRVDISTDSFTKTGPGSVGDNAARIGGGAALGAIVGAIAGGGKGAAIGAGVGGAAGAGSIAATHGKPAVLPSETKISFRLNSTVTVTERPGS